AVSVPVKRLAVALATEIGADLLGPMTKLVSLQRTAGPLQEVGVTLQALGQRGVFRRQVFLAQLERLAAERLGVLVSFLRLEDPAQLVELHCQPRVLAAEVPARNGERAPLQRFRLRQPPLPQAQQRQDEQALANARVFRTEPLL